MKNKVKRFVAIQEIISTTVVGSQEELLQKLAEQGFELTQATLSRDLKQLKVSKTTNSKGEYIYQLPTRSMQEEGKSHSNDFSRGNAVLSTEFSGNIVVVHTRPGYASSLAYEIDEVAKDTIIGTVAGEDTIIAVIKENKTREDVTEVLSQIIPSLK
ncbi:MAG: arginine repressor [Paludibacteraceae bacterium]|nr:arginine repressor [Paludibacteraceae bacterium]